MACYGFVESLRIGPDVLLIFHGEKEVVNENERPKNPERSSLHTTEYRLIDSLTISLVVDDRAHLLSRPRVYESPRARQEAATCQK